MVFMFSFATVAIREYITFRWTFHRADATMEKGAAADDKPLSNAITRSKANGNRFCCVCCKPVFAKVRVNRHTRSYGHKICAKRFESSFEDRGKKVFCKTCETEIDWNGIKDHAVTHRIPPWCEFTKPSGKTLYDNCTVFFDLGYYFCYLCDTFLDYWDTASSHFTQADHQDRKEKFGPIGDFSKVNYLNAVANGIVPGRDMMNECKMCNKTHLKVEDVEEHSKTKKHLENSRKTRAIILKLHTAKQDSAVSGTSSSQGEQSMSKLLKTDPRKEDDRLKEIIRIHEEIQNRADSKSNSVDTEESTSTLLEADVLAEENKPGNIKVPYRRNMISNFTLQEMPDNEIPEAKENLENDQTENPNLPVEGKPMNEIEDRPINYIVSNTSELCEATIVGTDTQRKRKIAKKTPEEPNPYCLICYSEIPGYAAVKDHLKGKRHKTASQKYGCDNILLLEGEHYWCSACDGPVSGFNNVYLHIRSNSHLSAVVGMQRNNRESQNNFSQAERPMEAEESLPCLYIVKQNAKKSFCQICDETQHPVATKNINDHIASQRHKVALKRYGCDNIVPKGNDNYHCKCCLCDLSNIESVYLHIKEKKHMSSLIKVANYEEQRGREKIEVQMLPEDLNKPFQNLLSDYIHKQINESLPTQSDATWEYSMMSNFEEESNETERDTSSNTLKPPEQKWFVVSAGGENSGASGSTYDFTEVQRKPEKPQGYGIKMSAREYEAQAQKIQCNVCGAKAGDTTQLHIHMASHYTEEFAIFKQKNGKGANESSHQAGQALKSPLPQPEVAPEEKIPNGIATNGFFNPTVESPNLDVPDISSENNNTKLVSKSEVTIQDKDPKKKKMHVKRANMTKVAMLLDFNEDHIYDLDDKLKDVKHGMMLGLVVDSSRMYCLVCRNVVEYNLDNYYEHLESIDHCQYLDEMEADDSRFQDLKDQFSDLALAKEYMVETSEDKVRCVICDEDVKNNARSLQAHIYHEIHERKCEETRAIARKCFEIIKRRMYCDWYEVQKYWCVACETHMESEVKFVAHFHGSKHKKVMKRRENKDKRFIFDFCASCALLWYGYRCTHFYHKAIDAHKWLQRDGHYVLTELPMHAKSLLASPEDFVEDKIKFLNEVFEGELDREKWLIRDLEKAARMRFPRSKAHVFGSRISGLGSPDSDIDVFLDCRNFYNGNHLTNDELLFYINGVHQSLCKDPQLWDVDELLTECRIPIIRATHRGTELSCDISFENGLSVENTKLIKAFNQAFPSCRKMTLFLKQWLLHCGLSGSRGISNYALYWFVIFYLQQEWILPSVGSLIAMRGRSHIIAGWEVGVTHDFTYNAEISTFTIKKLLEKFFLFYACFDFRYDVACPLLGEAVKKREFVDPRSLPREMERYIAYMERPGKLEPFRIDSPMCIQDPFDLQHNLTKAVNKVYLNRFRKCCAKSFELIQSA